MAILEVKGLKKEFARKRERVPAVRGIDFFVEEGECLGLVGESGCGKSTTANLAARLLREDAGEIYFRGKRISGGKRLHCVGRELQMVFQDPGESFDPRYSLLEAVMQGARAYKMYSKNMLREKALEMISYVGLSPKDRDFPVRDLSGGQCQRAAVARAMLCEPKLIILDEATSALDVSVQAQLMGLFLRLKKEKNTAFLFITHDLALAAAFCDRLAVMKDGRIVETGPTEELLLHPRHPYTKELISCVLQVS